VALQADKLLCAECYDMEVTCVQNIQPATVVTAPAVPIHQKVAVDNTYAMAWTDGGAQGRHNQETTAQQRRRLGVSSFLWSWTEIPFVLFSGARLDKQHC